ncbi:MAG: S8/S53 family peptidase [Actinomycetota bacterium]|nr:S8/S53 family peptidase [Actinomycetota bacterium]
MRRCFVAAITLLCLAASLSPAVATPPKEPRAEAGRPPMVLPKGPDDVTVVATIDRNFVPYHWDFLASKMPQALDNDSSNDLPLDRPPHEWLPGFPHPDKAFKSYNRFDLTLDEKNPDAPLMELDAKDKAEWHKVKKSTFDEVNYYWMPGTKVIGAVEFGANKLHGEPRAHGLGVTSVSVGNIHGTCPECLLVFINNDDNTDEDDTADAFRWAMAQPWIDVVSNSYGDGVAKVYNGPGVTESLEASERGQSVVFSAGNGIENLFTVPNSTYASSEKGPDWIITVGAVSPGKDNPYGPPNPGAGEHSSYVGAGKPVDVAGLGRRYPSAYDSQTVGGTGASGFDGTSNAAPTIAGTYARALYMARLELKGPSRIQEGGVVAVGRPYKCGSARPKCELKDGKLTAIELRNRLFKGAIHTAGGTTTLVGGEVPPVGEEEFMSEGHGTYFARETRDDDEWLKEFARITGPMFGYAKELERPEGEKEWMIVDSYCRQEIWATWTDGYYNMDKTPLPGPDPQYPIRSALEESCPALPQPPG